MLNYSVAELRFIYNVYGLDCELFAKFQFQERYRIPINKKRPQPDFTCLITGAKIGQKHLWEK